MDRSLSQTLFETEHGLKTPPLLIGLTIVAAGTLAVAIGMVFFYAPTERLMGFVQKIFYYHVPSAWNTLLSAPLVLYGSTMYLATKKEKYDRLSDAALELALVFSMLTLISGPLWGRKAWGVFWVWDARLTSFLVLVLTMIATKIVRGYAGPTAKKVAAGLSLLAVLNTAFVWVSVDYWRGAHPPKLIYDLEPKMYTTWFTFAIGMGLVYFTLLWIRLRVGALRAGLDRIHMQVTEAGLDE